LDVKVSVRVDEARGDDTTFRLDEPVSPTLDPANSGDLAILDSDIAEIARAA
jgi:hypothetical protein